jgi:hypothetical protein
MNRVFKDLQGSWILFFHYMKYPILVSLPLLYLEMGYKRDTVMDIIWLYCLYLVLDSLYQRFVKKSSCSPKDGCNLK